MQKVMATCHPKRQATTKKSGLCGPCYASQWLGVEPSYRKRHKTDPILEWILEQCAPANEKGCRVWTRAINYKGYARLASKPHGTVQVTRIIWMEVNNQKIPEGMLVMHTCDNPPCCNPEHLFLGTVKDNAADASIKGINCHGEKHPLAKLNEQQVRVIWKLKHLVSPYFLATIFGIKVRNIYRIWEGELWKNITTRQTI